MTVGGFGGGSGDPFGGAPGGGPGYGSGGFAASGPGYPAGNHSYPGGTLPPPPGEVNTLSTLSVVFAVIFAPAGAALGHIALHQIRQRGQRGRERALIGLTLSYVVIVAAIIALVIWLLSDNPTQTTASIAATTTATATTTAKPAPPPPPRTTVITAPPTTRPTVQVEELKVGDCVERVQNEPDPKRRREGDNIGFNYRTPCEARDGVLVVTQIAGSRDECPSYSLWNPEETIYACVSDYRS